MKKLLLCLIISIFLTTPVFALDIKTGGLFNYQEGTQDFITAVTVYSWEDIEVDIWSAEVDRLIGLETEYSIGGAIAYNFGNISEYLPFISTIPIISVIDQYVDLSLGYGLGVKNLLTHDCELVHGIYSLGISIEF